MWNLKEKPVVGFWLRISSVVNIHSLSYLPANTCHMGIFHIHNSQNFYTKYTMTAKNKQNK